VVGIVVVSHSAALAASVIDFARAMGGDKAPMEPAGGVEDGIGTDFELIGAAIERAAEASGGDGVLVLMDLGSAVQTAQMVLELGELDPAKVRLVAAPLVEGAVAASINSGGGGSLEEVAQEALGALRAKQAELGETSSPSASSSQSDDLAGRAVDGGPVDVDIELPVRNRLGLHARPAAKLVGIAMDHDADLLLSNATTGRGPVNARSLSDIALLGVRGGHTLRVQARGPQADAVVAEVRELAETGFGDGVDASPPPAAASQRNGASGAPPAPQAPAVAPDPGTLLQGIPASPGLADGPLRRLGGAPAIPEADAEDPEAEAGRLEEALAAVGADLGAARDDLVRRGRAKEAAIFEAQTALLGDAALLDPARAAIADGRNAARAIHASAEALAARYDELDDDYLRERAADVRDVGRRVVRALLGERDEGAQAGEVLVADELLPGDAAALDPAIVAGVATAHGGATGHAAIIARSLGVPTVVGLGPALLAVREGTRLLLDGDAGTVLVDPDPEALARHQARATAAAERHARAAERAGEPAVTRDGTRIEVVANLGDVDGAAHAVQLGAEGVGLLRTEFLFLGRDELPGEDEQAEAYGRIARDLDGRPLIIRTLDVGADKPLAAIPQEPEANPFLGQRGLRLQLARPELLSPQLRAILRTAADHPVKVMFPMVATLGEVRAARAALDEARAALGIDPPLDVGVMVEVPAVAVQAERFAAELDFLSIGTNDLAQYTMAAERGNEHVAPLATGPVPAVLRLVELTVRGAAAHGRWVGVCGELAGDVDGARLLVGLGVTELSMAPPRIADVKEALRDLDHAAAREAAQRALQADTPEEARAISAELAA
jgi:phosphocarrier protein FPr